MLKFHFMAKEKKICVEISFLTFSLMFFQVKIQKDSEVRLKIIGTRVDATEIV